MVHLLPILLLGLSDEGQGIRDATVACLNQVAEKHKAVHASSAANQVRCSYSAFEVTHNCLHASVQMGPGVHTCAFLEHRSMLSLIPECHPHTLCRNNQFGILC